MFVRWELYRSQARDRFVRKAKNRHARLKAALVESVRVDGESRQRHIAFLGSTRKRDKSVGRARFWYNVTTTLNRLGDLVSRDDRKRIEAAIVKKVGGKPMTKAQLRKFEKQQRAELLGDLARLRDKYWQ